MLASISLVCRSFFSFSADLCRAFTTERDMEKSDLHFLRETHTAEHFLHIFLVPPPPLVELDTLTHANSSTCIAILSMMGGGGFPLQPCCLQTSTCRPRRTSSGWTSSSRSCGGRESRLIRSLGAPCSSHFVWWAIFRFVTLGRTRVRRRKINTPPQGHVSWKRQRFSARGLVKAISLASSSHTLTP